MISARKLKSVSGGRIARMDIPDDWQEQQAPEQEGSRYTREFKSEEHPEASFAIHYRGYPMDADSAGAFLSLLAQPAHALTKGEIVQLSELIGAAGSESSCRLEEILTTKIGDRTVLLLQALWAGDRCSRQIFIAADNSASFVQEIWCMSPAQQFAEIMPVFESALASIEWIDTASDTN